MNFDCPIPELDFDVITLGHGSGGLLTNRLLESGVFRLFSNPQLDDRHDGAILDITGPLAFSTDSFVVSPIIFPGGTIGDLAVNGTVNDLAMCGALPKYLALSFILEEGLTMQEFWEVLVSIKMAADLAGVTIVTGDTKVVEKGKGDKIFITTTGIGVLLPGAKIHSKHIQPGDKILVSGSLANHGVAIMSVRKGLEFETQIKTDSAPLNEITTNLINELGAEVHLLRDPTRGGLATVLAEIAKQVPCGVNIYQELLPVKEEVLGACELLGLDPLFVANEGLFVLFVAAGAANKALEVICSHPRGKDARIIGEVSENHPGQVVLHNEIGGKRVINMLPGEQLPRIC